MKDNATNLDYARLAAFIDGEGCIGVYEYSPKPGQPRWIDTVRVVNTDPRLVLWLKDTFGGRIWGQELELPKRTKFTWEAGNKLAEKLLKECLPFFVLKRDQAELFLSYRRTLRTESKIGKPRGVKISDELVAHRRGIAHQLKQLKKIGYTPTFVDSAPPVLM